MRDLHKKAEIKDKTKGTILIVDDIPENLYILNKILIDNGYTVRPARNGESALKFIQTNLPDIILLDIKMPEIDGFEVCSRLKKDKRTSDIPVIFISALNDINEKIKGFKAGAVDYITKPFDSDELLARVRSQMICQNLKKRLKEQNKELLEITRQREDVNHVTHHDLKGLLSPIISSPDLIRKLGPLTMKQSKYLEQIEKAGQKMLKVINRSVDPMLLGIYKDDQE